VSELPNENVRGSPPDRKFKPDNEGGKLTGKISRGTGALILPISEWFLSKVRSCVCRKCPATETGECEPESEEQPGAEDN
jgi:hypothetical protein